MGNNFIDINCDVGEGIGNEESLFPFISSCNIACGGHAGDDQIMNEIVVLAKKNKVK
ncbi:MAG: LamB/YcsF family protein, partial [Flavobacteriales bacterium]